METTTSSFVLLTDSCADLTPELAGALQVSYLPLTVMQEGREYQNYFDHRDLDPKVFYDKLRKGSLGSTSAVNVEEFSQKMEQILQEGKDILCLAFSSALSSTYQSAVIAAGELQEQYPQRTIEVVDTRCASMGQGLLVYLAGQEQQKGRSLAEVKSFVEETIPRLCHFFTVDDLNHLKRGGRVSSAAALVGTMLQMKPILHVDDEGRLIPIQKVRGRKTSIKTLADKMAELCTDKSIAFISHGDCEEDALALKKLIEEQTGVEQVVISYVGPVIGNHSGPGTLALFFLGQHR